MGISASRDVCVVAQLTTTKPDTLALVPLTTDSIGSVDSAIFKSLYKSRSDMFIHHWFGSPEADMTLPEGFDRKTTIAEVPSAAAYHEDLMKKLSSGNTNMWSVVSFGAHPKGVSDLGKLPKIALIEEKLAREDSGASMSTCGFYAETVVAGIEDEKDVTWIDYWVTKQLCNDAKSSAVVQLVASLPNSSPPKAPLSFRFREGNIPLLRMVQKIYRAHIAFHDGSEEEKEETASVSPLPLKEGSPKWLAFTLHTDRVVKGLHYRLKNTIRDEPNVEHFSIFSDKQPNPLPTPVDSYVTEGQAIWTAEGAAIAPHSTPIETRKNNRNKLRESEKVGSMTVSSSQGNSMQAGGSISPGASYGVPGGNGVVPSASLFQMGYPAAPGMAPAFIRPAASGSYVPVSSASQSGLNASAAAFTPSGSLAGPGLTGSPQLPPKSSQSSGAKGRSETSEGTSQASRGKSVIPQFMTAPPTTHAPLQDEKDKNEMKLKALTPVHVLEDDNWRPLWWSNASISLIQCENQPFLEKGSIILKAPLESEFVNEKRQPTKVRVTGEEASYFVSVLMSNIEEQSKKREKKEKREKSGKSSKHREREESRSTATSPSTSVTTSQRTTPQTSQQGVFTGERKPTTTVPLSGSAPTTAIPIVGPGMAPTLLPGAQPTFLAPGPGQPVMGPNGMQMVPMQQILIPAGMPAPAAGALPPGMIPFQPGQPMMPGAVPVGQPFLPAAGSAPMLAPLASSTTSPGPIQPPQK